MCVANLWQSTRTSPGCFLVERRNYKYRHNKQAEGRRSKLNKPIQTEFLLITHHQCPGSQKKAAAVTGTVIISCRQPQLPGVKIRSETVSFSNLFLKMLSHCCYMKGDSTTTDVRHISAGFHPVTMYVLMVENTCCTSAHTSAERSAQIQ